ncbi:MAG TPA: type IV secretion system DNA-binding domain-containing protein [Xanthomonadales bacterium]|nr:type IV secretion system DNA-binding domain-containing protein [Xanthomonadales bacterium]
MKPIHLLRSEAGKPTHHDRVLLEVKTSRTGEETPESMVQFLASLTNLKRLILPFWGLGVPISLEIAVIDQGVHFFLSIPKIYQTFIESQLVAVYPKAIIIKSKDYLESVFENSTTLSVGQMKLRSDNFYPIKTFSEFKDVDPMGSLLGHLSKSQPQDKISIQFLLKPVGSGWQARGERAATHGAKDASGVEHANPYSKVIMQKISVNGFKTAIRIAVNSDSLVRSEHLIREISNSFSSFSNPSGNSLIFRRVFLWQKERLIKVMKARSRYFMPQQILNIHEIATMFHFPSDKLAKIHNITWHKTILSEPPEKLPISEGLTPDEKTEINFFARTEFKNKMTTFGIKQNDRRRHTYIIGKTGTGKSTLIANLAISDIRNRKGMCIIDPHGDLCETILDYIPSYRINDVIYLDPSDLNHAFSLNPIEVTDAYQMELVVSGIVATFHKIYGESWGPRLEYILRNTLMTVVRLPNPTLLMVPEMLTNDEFRKKAMTHIDDPVLKSFWEGEFANMTEKLRAESISPILNKVGQFISSRFIRNIISSPKSTIDIEKIMNEGKILLLNLSQGRLGEDNSALLGAMFITKIQLAAMNRVSIAEAERRDFYLYVDEFQNFATTSFIKILSEARKYRLNLILANQYISQIPQDVRGAIFGNAGTMMSFLVGAEDAGYMAREFTERFKEEDLLALGNYQAIVKLAIDSITQSPFLAYTLPLPQSATQNREKVIANSRARYMKKVEG